MNFASHNFALTKFSASSSLLPLHFFYLPILIEHRRCESDLVEPTLTYEEHA